MKKIPLRNKNKEVIYYAIVDDDDYEKLNKYTWYFNKTNKLGRGYAARKMTVGYEFVDGKKKRITKTILMHREILDADPHNDVDHINKDTLDNRKSNLRLCKHSQNCANRSKQSNNTSGYKGVSWSKEKSKWRARLTVNNNEFNLGYYDDIDFAAMAYNIKSIELLGEFAELNVIKRKFSNDEITTINTKISTTNSPKGRTDYYGVRFDKKNKNRPFVVFVRHNGKRLYLGSYKDSKTAAYTYNCVMKILFGNDAKLNEV